VRARTGLAFALLGALAALTSACRRSEGGGNASASSIGSAPPASASSIGSAPPASASSSRPAEPDFGPGVTSWTATLEGEPGRPFALRALRVDLGTATLSIVPVPGARLEALAADRSLRFAVNAGFFEPSYEPSGLLVSRGRRLGALAPRGGSGVLWVAGGRARLFASNGALPDLAGVDLALQCGPRLVESGRPGVHRDDGRRAARTALCLRDGGRSLDIVLAWNPDRPGDGPGLHRLAELLSRPLRAGDEGGCEDALNLDGGPSTGVTFSSMPAGWGPHAPGPVPWALAVTRP
jgi:phosphodiester glycosidase